MTTAQKPAYLGVLNNISLAESCAGRALKVWASQTADPRVREVLELVTAREEEHGLSFARRIEELRYSLIERDVPGLNLAEEETFLSSDRPDLEKLRHLYPADRPDLTGFLDRLLQGYDYDPETRALMERYVAEEKDSGQRLRALLSELEEAASARS